MFRFTHNHGDSDLGLLVAVIIPAAGALCWIYNAYRMGKLRWKPSGVPNPRKVSFAVLAGILLAVLLLAAAR